MRSSPSVIAQFLGAFLFHAITRAGLPAPHVIAAFLKENGYATRLSFRFPLANTAR